MEISAGHHRWLLSVLEQICQSAQEPGKNKQHHKFGDQSTKDRCLRIWKDWVKASHNSQDVKTRRQTFMSTWNQIPESDTTQFLISQTLRTFGDALCLTGESEKRKLKKIAVTELKDWFETGCARAVGSEDCFINPTLMRPGHPQWHLHYQANPFVGNLPETRFGYYIHTIW